MEILQLGQDYLAYLQSNIPLLVGSVIGIFVWMLSGCLASTIGELRRHNPWVHLFGGLLIPFLYPVLIFFVLPVRGEKGDDKKEAKAAHADGAPPPKKTGGRKEPVVELEPAEEEVPASQWTPARLKQMSTDMEGNPRGPFIFFLKDGQEQRAERILDALPVAVSIEILDVAGKPQKLRIPYDQIDRCQEP